MNTNKILISGLIGGIFSFFLGWLLWGILFKDMMNSDIAGMMRPESEMVMWAMALACLSYALLLSFIFVQWANISTWLSGAKAGAIIGLLIYLNIDLGMYSTTNIFSMTSVATDIVLGTFYSACIGAVIGFWLGRK